MVVASFFGFTSTVVGVIQSVEVRQSLGGSGGKWTLVRMLPFIRRQLTYLENLNISLLCC